MNYELAKQLKDAGFPQEGKGETIGVSGGLIEHSGDVYLPTLSELIEACGEEFYSLLRSATSDGEKMDKGLSLWHAIIYQEKSVGTGETPEEAVARLYIALNKK